MSLRIPFPKDKDLAWFGGYPSKFIFDVRTNLIVLTERRRSYVFTSFTVGGYLYLWLPYISECLVTSWQFCHTLICFACLIICHGDFSILGLTYALLHCGRMVSHSSVFSSVPPWWTGAECINLETQSLHIHTYRQVEFIAFLCRVKEERNEAEVCAWARLHVHVGSVYLRVNSEVMESLHVRIAFVLLYILHGLWESYTAEGGEGPVLPRKAW